jgi:dinuclear metal center YbgI/SA1388 family protein
VKEDLVHTVGSIIDELGQLAPLTLAAEWDNVGLLLGDRTAEVRRVMTCLTVTPESAAEAIEAGVQLVVTHHPVLFRAVKRLTADTAEGKLLAGLIRAGVAVYSPHTAFDDAAGGINESIARRLGLTGVVPLRRREARQCKVVVFVPDSDLAKVSDAMFETGAGHIGQYSQCSFRLGGTGTFYGSEASNPTVGQRGRREEVQEWRLEVICPESLLEPVLRAMRQAHSYEEPAFDVYPLRPAPGISGTGRVGSLPAPASLDDVAGRVKAALGCGLVQVVGDGDRRVERVAIVCGAGGELLGDAVRARADVFLTGELRFHDCLAAQAQGIGVVLPGHHATERFGLEELAERLRQRWPDLEVWASTRESDPLRWV